MTLDELTILQNAYNALSRERGLVIKEYDRAPDGSAEKKEASDRLTALGVEILNTEKAMDAEYDRLYQP